MGLHRCPHCATQLSIMEGFGKVECPACKKQFSTPFPWIQSAFFVGWVLAGVLIGIWYVGCLLTRNVHVYAVNGHNESVTISYENKPIAKLRPDETALLKLPAAGGLLTIEPAAAAPPMERLEEGMYLLNIGDGYWVSSKPLNYFTSVTTTTIDETKRYDRPGLYKVGALVWHPSRVCGFGEDVPGSMPADAETPQYKLGCGGRSGRHILPPKGWLGILTMPHEWGFAACWLPGAALAFVWLVGAGVLVPKPLPSQKK